MSLSCTDCLTGYVDDDGDPLSNGVSSQCYDPCSFYSAQIVGLSFPASRCVACGVLWNGEFCDSPFAQCGGPNPVYPFSFEVGGASGDCCNQSNPCDSHLIGPVGICCVPPGQLPAGSCQGYTTEACCARRGGNWRGTNLDSSNWCTGSRCPTPPSCCGCDWCCDEMIVSDCLALRSYPWETEPHPKLNNCGSTPICGFNQPVCRYEEFAVGKRPAAHEPPESGGTSHRFRHELHGVGPTRAIDRAPGVEECRTYYGHVGRGAPFAPATRSIGWLCGQHNRRLTSTKTANRCYPSKRPDGRHSFNCAYRVPCPEKPTVCL